MRTLPSHHEKLLLSTYNSVIDLATDDGINASGRDEVYGCIFGRDSAITILKLLNVCNNSQASQYIDTQNLLKICRNALLNLSILQGTVSNIESGEQPGKFIHEYRKDKYERLLSLSKPWYVYPDGILRNYDSLDSTPLALIAIYNYWKITNDSSFLMKILPSVEAGLNWIITYGDMDKDQLLEYELPKNRKHGGLVVQSWTDSIESITDIQGNMPEYPIAPVEVQGYGWLALKLWADYYANSSIQYAQTEKFSHKLTHHAEQMKKRFNETFLIRNNNLFFAAQALRGDKSQIETITGNPLLLLWATYKNGRAKECILDEKYISDFVKRAFQDDLFDPAAGIRTMSTSSPTYDPTINSYHNGSFWPKLNGMSHEGLLHWNFTTEAHLLKTASLKPIEYFGSPIELYVKTNDGEYLTYKNSLGQESCRTQAWSAASVLDWLTN